MRSSLSAVFLGLLVCAGPTRARADAMPSMPGMTGSAACPTPDPDSGAEMLGKMAPKWTFTR